jgi:hypothetical protein
MKTSGVSPSRIITGGVDARALYQGANHSWSRNSKTYYVANDGNDASDGLGRTTAWASLAKVNAQTLNPGDRVLFKRGHKWIGTLNPQGNGTAAAKIMLGAYGDGAHPLIDAQGAYAAIRLNNQSHWIIDGFEITNWAETAGARNGIRVDASSPIQGIAIRNNIVRDVRGGRLTNVADGICSRHHAGICVNTIDVKSDDIVIEDNYIRNMIGTGILFWGEDETNGTVVPSRFCAGVVIRGNVIREGSADGILLLGTIDEVVEHNHIAYMGMLGAYAASAYGSHDPGTCWGTRHTRGTYRFNHIHDGWQWVKGGGALGNDMFTTGDVLFEHNFIHDYEPGAFGDYYADYATTPPDAPGTGRAVFRYNLAIEAGGFFCNRDTKVFNNVFYGPELPFLNGFSSAAPGIEYRNNLFWCSSFTPTYSAHFTLDRNTYALTIPYRPADANGNLRAPQVLGPLPPPLLFRDTFRINREDAASDDINHYAADHQSGTMGIIPWTNNGGAGSQVGYDRSLRLTGGVFSETLQKDIAPHATGPIGVRVGIRCNSAADPSNWLSLMLHSGTPVSPMVNAAEVQLGVLFRQNGKMQSFVNGVDVAHEVQPWSRVTWATAAITIILTDTAGTGNPFAGNGTVATVYSNGEKLFTRTLPQMTAARLSIGVYDSQWGVFPVEIAHGDTLTDARYLQYDRFIPAPGSPELDAGTVVAAGKEDFFGNVIASDAPNRGMSETTSRAGYVQTLTRLEVFLPSILYKPASGSHAYEAKGYCRDQRNLVMAGQAVTWSMFPAISGVTVDAATGVISVASTAVASRFVLKASAGDVTRSFPVTVA